MNDRSTQLLDDVAAYALDALEPEEVGRVEASLRTSPELRAALDEHHAVLAVLAEAVDPHPSTLSPLAWENISRQIDGKDHDVPRLASASDIRAQRKWSRITAGLAVAALALAGLLSVSVIRLQQQRKALPTDAAIQTLLADDDSLVAALVAEGSTARAHIVLGADGIGYVYADTLPALSASRTYQLWAIVDDRVISAGVLGRDPEDSPFQIVGNVAGFAITDEIAGGVAVSEGETVALWMRDG